MASSNMQQGKRVVFVRHGRSIFNELYKESDDNCPASDPWVIDSELSEKGFEQVRQRNEHLSEQIFNNNHSGTVRIISSPLIRCIQTCFHVLEAHHAIPSQDRITLDPDCTELEESSCDVGSTFEELIMNEKVKQLLEKHFDLSLVEGRGKWWYQSNDSGEQTVHFEPWDVFMKRVECFVEKLFGEYSENANTIVVFSHFTFIRECVNHLATKFDKKIVTSIIADKQAESKIIPITHLENREVIILDL